MKKRILALTLVLIMAISFVTACSKKSNLNSFDTLREMQEVKTGSFSYDVALKMDIADMGTMPTEVVDALKDLHIKFDGVIESAEYPYKLNMKIQYKLPNSDKYEDVTDIVYVDDVYYINLKTIRDLLQNMNNSTVSIYSGFLTSETDYIKITKEDLEYIAQLSGTTVDTSELTMSADSTKAVQLLADKFITILEKTSKDVKPEMVSEDKGTHTISINNENIDAILTSFKKVMETDGATLYNEYYEEVKKLENVDQALLDQLEANKDTFVTDVTTEVDKLLTEKKEDPDTDIDFKWNYSLEGKEGKRKVDTTYNFTAKDAENNLEVVFDGTVDEANKADGVKAPAEATSLTDFINTLMSAFGAQ